MRDAVTRGLELKRQPAIFAAYRRRLSPTEIRATDITRSETREQSGRVSSDAATSGLVFTYARVRT